MWITDQKRASKNCDNCGLIIDKINVAINIAKRSRIRLTPSMNMEHSEQENA